MKKVLIIEDSKDISEWLRVALELKGYDCIVVNSNFEQLLNLDYYNDIDIIILDIWLRSTTPYELDTNIVKNDDKHLVSMQVIQIVRKLPRHIKIIVFSALSDIAGLAEYVDAVLVKPATINEVIRYMEDL